MAVVMVIAGDRGHARQYSVLIIGGLTVFTFSLRFGSGGGLSLLVFFFFFFFPKMEIYFISSCLQLGVFKGGAEVLGGSAGRPELWSNTYASPLIFVFLSLSLLDGGITCDT